MHSSSLSCFSRILALLSATAALITMLVTAYVLSIAHWHGPFRDMWEIYPFLVKIIDGSWGIRDLWESYGYSHRLLIPKLLYIADYVISGASNHLLIATSLICQLGIVAVFAWALGKESQLTLSARVALMGIVWFLQFSGSLLFNLMHTFDVQWFLCCFWVVSAMAILARQEHVTQAFLLSALCIAAACLCNFSGMAAWPIWLAALVYSGQWRLPRQQVICGLAIFFVAAYTWSAKTAGLAAAGEQNAIYLMVYFLLWFPLMYLSSPLSDPDYATAGMWSALLPAAALVIIAGVVWRRRKASNWSIGEKFSLAISIFCFGVALMTGIGRGYDPSHVHASRYQNMVVLFWAAFTVFAYLQLRMIPGAKKYLVITPTLLVVSGFLVSQEKFWNENLLLGRNVTRSHLALMMGYSDNVPMISATVSRSMIYVSGYSLEKERALHEHARKGIYDGKLASYWLHGYPVLPAFKVCKNVHYTLSEKSTPYARFTEFIVEGNLEDYDHALLIDEHGKVHAIAVREPPALLGVALKEIMGIDKRPLRGISRVSDGNSLQLVMLSPNTPEQDCHSPPTPPITGEFE